MSNTGSSIYDILVFSFADTHTADEVVNELKPRRNWEVTKSWLKL